MIGRVTSDLRFYVEIVFFRFENYEKLYLPKPISCSRNGNPRQILSEFELLGVVVRFGSAVKCGIMKIMDPKPIITAPVRETQIE